MPVGIDPKVDYAFKWVFGQEANSTLLTDLLHAVLNPSPDEQITVIELLDPFTARESEEDKMLPNTLDTPEVRQAMASLAMLAESSEERAIYEGRLKTLRDERARLSDAESRGLDKGELVGRIAVLQRVLGLERTPRETLRAMSVEEMERLAEGLEGRLHQ